MPLSVPELPGGAGSGTLQELSIRDEGSQRVHKIKNGSFERQISTSRKR
jgi:hypothetical protein